MGPGAMVVDGSMAVVAACVGGIGRQVLMSNDPVDGLDHGGHMVVV